MQIVTKNNVEYGLKVRRGPAWRYGSQDEGSIYGVVGMIGNERVAVSWISKDKKEVINQANYYLSVRKDDDREDLCFYEEPLDDEAFELLVDTTDAWNGALELAVDTITQEYRKNNLKLDMDLDKLICLIGNLER